MSEFDARRAELQSYLTRRAAIVGSIETLLNCQKKPEYWQDFALLARLFTACFSDKAGTALRAELERAHANSGFEPRAQAGNALVDPVEQMRRAFHMWQLTRWPGQNGRVHFAQTLFNLEIVRNLALLGMRLWDDADDAGVPERLAQLQALLDALWQGSPPDQPVLVRDIRWLFPVAMSPTTDSLAGYFAIAERIASTFTEADRVETQKAWVVTGAGHLRAQLHSLTKRREVDIDDHELVLLTRVSNALDVALLMEGLVTLFEAYAQALQSGDTDARLALAAAICQGFSPDPELFIERTDLLGPYTMLEHLFIAVDAAGNARYTPAGERHLALLAQYRRLLPGLIEPLSADCASSKPADGAWSPYGALYGFASNLLELIAFRALVRDAHTGFGMEDVFTDGGADKLAWVDGWRSLPHIRPEIARQFTFPRPFAEAMHARVAFALQRQLDAGTRPRSGRLWVGTLDASSAAMQGAPAATEAPPLAAQHCLSSDPALIAAGRATAKDEEDLLHCRNEGEFLVSFATDGGWMALTKDLLTDVLGAGHDASIGGLPEGAAAVLKLMLAAQQ